MYCPHHTFIETSVFSPWWYAILEVGRFYLTLWFSVKWCTLLIVSEWVYWWSPDRLMRVGGRVSGRPDGLSPLVERVSCVFFSVQVTTCAGRCHRAEPGEHEGYWGQRDKSGRQRWTGWQPEPLRPRDCRCRCTAVTGFSRPITAPARSISASFRRSPPPSRSSCWWPCSWGSSSFPWQRSTSTRGSSGIGRSSARRRNTSATVAAPRAVPGRAGSPRGRASSSGRWDVRRSCRARAQRARGTPPERRRCCTTQFLLTVNFREWDCGINRNSNKAQRTPTSISAACRLLRNAEYWAE